MPSLFGATRRFEFTIPKLMSKSEIYLHYVWATWNRHPLLDAERAPTVHAALARKCLELRCVALAINGMPDHVHVLVRVPPTLAPAVLAKRLKGATSYYLNPHNGIPPSFRWQDGYAVFSVDRSSVDRVRRYVEEQQRHHESGRLWSRLELE